MSKEFLLINPYFADLVKEAKKTNYCCTLTIGDCTKETLKEIWNS